MSAALLLDPNPQVFTASAPPALPAAIEPGRRAKDAAIETLRGLALVLMVFGHVIGDTVERGLHADGHSFLRFLYFVTQYLRMPLFTVISGFVYAMRPVDAAGARRFVAGKCRRLLLPLVSVATLAFAVKHAVPGVNRWEAWSEMWTIYVFGYDQFWFLQAIFLVFLTILLVDGSGLMKTERSWFCLMAGSVLVAHYSPRAEFFSIWGYEYLLPFFFLGCGLRRFPDLLAGRGPRWFVAACLLAGLGVQVLAWFGLAAVPLESTGWLGLLVGVTGTTLLLRSQSCFSPFARIGKYSFTVYLLHVFGTAGGRIVLLRLGVHAPALLILGSLTFGIAGPIMAHRLLEHYRWTRLLILGLGG